MRTKAYFVSMFFLAFGLAVAQPDQDVKIHPALFQTFIDSEDGTAPFYIMFGDRTPLAAAYRIQDWAARGSFVVASLQATASRSQNGVRGYLQGHKVAYVPFWVQNKIYIPQGTLDLARDLARRPDVAAIVPEVTFKVPPPQTGGGTQSIGWNISLIGADKVWTSYSNRGTGIVLANIDTGVQYTHPALVNQYRGNLGGGRFDHSVSWSDPSNACGGAPCDNVGHGSHTMGTMVGDDGGANQVGVAPGAKWIACKGCESDSCSGVSLTSCAQWILAPGGNSTKRPNIVNNSWGGGSGDSWYQSYVQGWVAAGIFPAFSAGNSGSSCNTATSPGDYPESFASGATDSGDNIAYFSSRGPSAFGGIKPNVSAPGYDIYSSVPTNRYAYYSGTSMASPHTAGTVALLWAIRPSYVGNIAATKSLIQNNAAVKTTTETCGGLGAGVSPNNTYGYGRIDASATVNAGGAPPPNQPPTVTITKPASDYLSFNCGVSVSFAATATDTQDGNLTSLIKWSGPGTPSTGTGGSLSKKFSCTTEVGNQTITALVTDKGNLSATDTVIVTIVNPNKPAAPSGLLATLANNGFMLSWTDHANNETGFKVHRRQQNSKKKWGSWSVLQPYPTATQFADSPVAAGTYQYYVTAYNAAGESAPSNTVQVTK